MLKVPKVFIVQKGPGKCYYISSLLLYVDDLMLYVASWQLLCT